LIFIFGKKMATEKKRFRFYWHLVWEFLRRYLAIVLGLIILIGATFFLNLKFNLFQKKVLRIGLTGQYQAQTLPQQVTRLISQGLVTVNPDGSYSPAAAKEWQINNEGREYVFRLQDNLVWDDGRPPAKNRALHKRRNRRLKKQNQGASDLHLHPSSSAIHRRPS